MKELNLSHQKGLVDDDSRFALRRGTGQRGPIVGNVRNAGSSANKGLGN
jgi:hypothetical protein